MLEEFHQQKGKQHNQDTAAQLLSDPHTGVLLLGHGSRRTEANQEWEQIWQMFKKMHPQLTVQRGYIEFMHPSLEEGIALLLEKNMIQRVVIVPLLLTTGKHLYQNIPERIRKMEEQYPGVEFALTEHIGPDSLLLKIIEHRIQQTGLFEERSL